MSAEESELEKWESILAAEGLSMGNGLHWNLGYGARYFDSLKTIEYGNGPRYARQHGDNITQAEKLLTLTDSGLSISAAARRLGLSQPSASRTLKRYRHKANQ